jgi:tRNA U54 and U55 pseudouridine synthase Pus10
MGGGSRIQETIKRIYLKLVKEKGLDYAESFRKSVIDEIGRPVLSLEDLKQDKTGDCQE